MSSVISYLTFLNSRSCIFKFVHKWKLSITGVYKLYYKKYLKEDWKRLRLICCKWARLLNFWRAKFDSEKYCLYNFHCQWYFYRWKVTVCGLPFHVLDRSYPNPNPEVTLTLNPEVKKSHYLTMRNVTWKWKTISVVDYHFFLLLKWWSKTTLKIGSQQKRKKIANLVPNLGFRDVVC